MGIKGYIEMEVFYASIRGIFKFSKGKLEFHFQTSLVAQWLRIRLPMQGTQVQTLVQEDPACCRATKPAPFATTRESPHAAMKTQHSQK